MAADSDGSTPSAAAPAAVTLTAEQIDQGLSAAEVADRVAKGQANTVSTNASRSVKDIIRANVFTRINAMLGVLLVIVLAAGSPIDGMFGLVIIFNSAIGIIQEVRAKRTLEKLAIVGQARPVVRRDGKAAPLDPAEVVVDDIIELGPGDQIVVDGIVVRNDALDVDESLLTGEADAVDKPVGAQVLSGSFVSSGAGAYRATKVGDEAYANKLASEASKFTLVKSELMAGINKILRFITWLLIPAGALSIYNQLFLSHQALSPALIGMVAALVPMVPEGLVLMTSIAFAVGVVRLGQRNALVQELPAIEGLARVDIVCADKTGTLTENAMVLTDFQAAPGGAGTAEQALAQLAADDAHPNASMAAIAEHYTQSPAWGAPTADAPFSSAKKWSGRSYGTHGNWLLGAPDVLLDPQSAMAEQAEALGAKGLRILLIAESDRPVDATDAPGEVTPRGLVVLEQKVRPDAKPTIEYFNSQHVGVKVISGDNAVSAAAVAGSLGLQGADDPVDARTLPTEAAPLAQVVETHSIFGRVRPDQKRAMVGALQSKGHTVAMTGDGVNDVLALKDADIGVAMGSGSPATRAVAQIVLLDNKFATLPHVVGEGRRVIGNIERVSNLFLTKTVYSVFLAFLVGLGGIAAQLLHFDPIPFPFLPRHVTITAWFTIGIPSFILSLAPNNERARSGFVRRVMRLAVPSGAIIGIASFTAYLLAYQGAGQTEAQTEQAGTTALITLITIAIWVLVLVARPLNWWKVLLIGGSVVGYVVLFAIPFAREFFKLDPSNTGYTAMAFGIGAIGIVAVQLAYWINRRTAGPNDVR